MSQWGKPPQEVVYKPEPTVEMKVDPLTQVNTMSAAWYFSYAAELMKLHAPHVTEWSTLARLARLGIERGQSFDFDKATPEVKRAMERATVDGLQMMKSTVPPANAFWSVTLYDAEGFQAANGINRFAIGDRDAL